MHVIKISLTSLALLVRIIYGAAVVEWSSLLAEQRVRGSVPRLAISEIRYLLLPSRDMTERLPKRRKVLKTTQPKRIIFDQKSYGQC